MDGLERIPVAAPEHEPLRRDTSGQRVPYGPRGLFEGTAFYVLEDGQLALGEYSGRWSDVPGEENHRALLLTAYASSAEWEPIMRAYDVNEIITGMADLLERHAKSAPKRVQHAEDALERARRLREAALLLKDAG